MFNGHVRYQWTSQQVSIFSGLISLWKSNMVCWKYIFIYIYIQRNLYGWCVYLATCYQQYRFKNQLDDFKNQWVTRPYLFIYIHIYIYMRTYCIYPCLFITLHLKCTHGPDFSLQCSSARHDPQQDVSARPNDPNGGGGGCSKNMQDGAPKHDVNVGWKTMK